MLKMILVPLVLQLLLLSNGSDAFSTRAQQHDSEGQTGTLEKMIVANGSVTMDIDFGRLNGGPARRQMNTLRFGIAPDSFFTILVLDNSLRGPLPGSMALVPRTFSGWPSWLNSSLHQLVIEKVDGSQPFDIVVSDGKTGFVFFNIEGNLYDYDAETRMLSIKEGRLLLSREFAAKVGRPAAEGTAVGTISITATMRSIEVTQVVNGEARSVALPALTSIAGAAAPTLSAGPDVIVGDLPSLVQSGSDGTQVGLAVATTSCNLGNVELDWFQLPNNDHPVIPQNLYRLSGGVSNTDRFEQIGQSWLKHAFTALQETVCGPCTPAANGTHLGVGCSDPYSTSLNGSQNSLGSRAWVNPFTGAFPGSNPTPNSHTGHTHVGTSHRILVNASDLNTTLNPGATYYAEAQYVTPHEYAWCQAHPGECNMYNNASFRQFNVTGTTSFTFTPAGATAQTKPALSVWPGAIINSFEPVPGVDGTGSVAYKVTNPSPGVWHYEYAVYNQNLDRAIQSFSIPLGAGATISNLDFHAPPQSHGFTGDGTVGDAGYSSTPWTSTQTATSLTWTSETFAQNPNANAIRWGTMYNFRFDSNLAPQNTNATVGFFKTGGPITVQVQAPSGPPLPGIAINDVSLTEGNAGTTAANFSVTLAAASTQPVTVQYATANGLATAGSDYVAASGTVTFTPGQVSQPISVTVNGDLLDEPNETFFVNLSNPSNATITDGQGVATINNDDAQAALPAGFAETQINGLANPTALALHPDGRIFVCEQSGNLRIIKNGALLPTPFTTISVNSPNGSERGLLGIAIDPNYAANHFVYVYYTAPTPTIHNRVSRFTADIANEDVAVAGSEVAILDLESLGATNHNGGAIHFGPDGKLYVAVGENAVSANAQSLANRLGKMLRINPDGTFPADNPLTFPNIAGSPTGLNRAIWSVGLRNPYTFTFQPGTGRMHINDVGQNTWEEINNGIAGSNYGWPSCEGACGVAGMTNPIYQYSSSDPANCAITGGAFYNPTIPTFPALYVGKYFFADFCGGWLKTIDPLSPPPTSTAPNFATGISLPVDIQTANDGSLYYLARGSNSVFRVQYFGASTIALNDVSVTEGNSGISFATFTVNLSPASAQTVTVQFATANNTALAGSDYVATNSTLTFSPGQTTQQVSVTINGDTTFEPNESFFMNLSNATNATIDDNQALGTITNDDAQPTISINDVTVTEGNSGTTNAAFTASLSNPSYQTITVGYATTGNTATAGSDFVAASGTVTITPGLTSQPVNITINGDTTPEPDETYFVNLSSPTNATISDSQGIGTITNDDVATPTISINDVSVTEGNAGTTTAGFTVSLSSTSTQTVTVNFATADNTAAAGSDYVANSGTVTFAPGQTSQPITVTINGDLLNEPNETFNVNLSSPSNATIADNLGVGTINNDDAQPALSINDVSIVEGNVGTGTLTFTVSLSAASGQTVALNYATANGTATAGSDYAAASGTLTFLPGITTQPINVTINGDLANEANETLLVNLSNATNATIGDNQGVGTINDDDALPTLLINDVAVTEGNAGTSLATFTVSLATASGQTVNVNYATADGTASSGSDYVPASGTLTFAPGETAKAVSITVNGDTGFEADETFVVNLSAAMNAMISDSQGQGTIVNDDLAPQLQFTQPNFDHSEAALSLRITVKRAGDPAPVASVDFQTIDSPGFVECGAVSGVASQRCDYLTTSGTLTFAANELEKSFRLIIYNDVYQEGNETINLRLSNPSGGSAVLGVQDTATVTVLDDDTVAPGTNPIDGAQFFVRQHYYDFLQRLPDQAGEDYWTGLLISCGADQTCLNNSRVTVSDAFFFEPEYQQTAAYVVRLYRTVYGNDQPFPNPGAPLAEARKLPSYAAFVKDRARVVGGPSLGASQADLGNAFVLRPEFLARYPAGLSGPDFVDTMLANIRNDLGVDLSTQRASLISLFNSGGRGAVLYRLADDNPGNPIDNRALIDAEYNRSLVLSQYFGYLRRNPDIPGFLFWLGQVNGGPLRDLGKQHAMVCSFITSQEYQQRFSTIFTRSNANCQ